jgi:sodium-dependent dicarboxylate transporter 2/3/5
LISKKAIIKNKKSFFIWIGLLLFTFLTIINPFSLAIKTNVVLASALLMVFWWITDALPMAMVALIPIILFPLFGISHIKNVTASYSDSILFLFMGGFLIGIAIEKWNLHKRIALTIIKKTGFNGNKIVLGFIISSGFLSLWLSNSATTMMMFPIAMSVIRVIEKNTYSEMDKKNFSISLLLATAYGSNFALGTIIGTPPNIAYVNYVSDRYNYTIGFTNWMIVFMPLTIVLLGILYVVLTKWLPQQNKRTTVRNEFYCCRITKTRELLCRRKTIIDYFSSNGFLLDIKRLHQFHRVSF